MSVLFKIHLSYLKDSIFECFFKTYNRHLIFLNNLFFSQHIIMESLSLEEENIITDVRNLFRLKKELSCAGNKDIRNLFRLKEKKTKAVKDRILRDIRIILSMNKKKKIVINQ